LLDFLLFIGLFSVPLSRHLKDHVRNRSNISKLALSRLFAVIYAFEASITPSETFEQAKRAFKFFPLGTRRTEASGKLRRIFAKLPRSFAESTHPTPTLYSLDHSFADDAFRAAMPYAEVEIWALDGRHPKIAPSGLGWSPRQKWIMTLLVYFFEPDKMAYFVFENPTPWSCLSRVSIFIGKNSWDTL
jgi:hypothetical protein